jgi:hypothetical protein
LLLAVSLTQEEAAQWWKTLRGLSIAEAPALFLKFANSSLNAARGEPADSVFGRT